MSTDRYARRRGWQKVALDDLTMLTTVVGADLTPIGWSISPVGDLIGTTDTRRVWQEWAERLRATATESVGDDGAVTLSARVPAGRFACVEIRAVIPPSVPAR